MQKSLQHTVWQAPSLNVKATSLLPANPPLQEKYSFKVRKVLPLPRNLHSKVRKAMRVPQNRRIKIHIEQPCQGDSQQDTAPVDVKPLRSLVTLRLPRRVTTKHQNVHGATPQGTPAVGTPNVSTLLVKRNSTDGSNVCFL